MATATEHYGIKEESQRGNPMKVHETDYCKVMLHMQSPTQYTNVQTQDCSTIRKTEVVYYNLP